MNRSQTFRLGLTAFGLAIVLIACPSPGRNPSAVQVDATATRTTLAPGETTSLNATVTATGALPDASVSWSIESGGGRLTAGDGNAVTYTAPAVTVETTVVVRATSNADDTASANVTLTVRPAGSGPDPTDPPPSGSNLALQNLDGLPYPDRLVFSRIGSLASPPSNGVHDRATTRIQNTLDRPLVVDNLAVVGPWTLDPAIALPYTIPVGQYLDVRLRFVAQNDGTQNGLYSGTLTVKTDDPANPTDTVELMGFWQSVSEGGQEPDMSEMFRIFGYSSVLTVDQQLLDNKGRVEAAGNEVLSPYWERADAAQPVTVRQLAAFHTQGDISRLFWYARGSSEKNLIASHSADDGQTLLPRREGNTGLVNVSFTPSTSAFGFAVDGEWSDPSKNDPAADRTAGCAPADRPWEVCGHHVRFWPVRDRQGQIVPNAYILIMDYAGINYDFNDNAYLITNIQPAGVLHRINVGGPAFTGDNGFAWKSDAGLFSPSGAIDEFARSQTIPIANTVNDVLYRTYRALVPAGNPPVLTFELPVPAGTKVGVRLHFVELNWGGGKVSEGGVGSRVFDVEVEGALKIDNLDVYKVTGGPEKALMIPIPGVTVSDGSLTIRLSASTDYPTLSGIEVVRE